MKNAHLNCLFVLTRPRPTFHSYTNYCLFMFVDHQLEQRRGVRSHAGRRSANRAAAARPRRGGLRGRTHHARTHARTRHGRPFITPFREALPSHPPRHPRPPPSNTLTRTHIRINRHCFNLTITNNMTQIHIFFWRVHMR